MKILKTILKRLGFNWQTEILVEYLLNEKIQGIEPKIKVSIKEASVADLDKLKDIAEGNKLDIFKKRFERGEMCFIATSRDKIAYYGWMGFGDEYEDNCQINVKLNKKEEAYWFDCWTVPEYRKMGLHTAVTTKALIYLKDRGYKKVSSFITTKNAPSLKAFWKIGFKNKKIVTFIELFGLKFHIWRKFNGDLGNL
jgi:RimJ/RimL family protein N-acetyltransferase